MLPAVIINALYTNVGTAGLWLKATDGFEMQVGCELLIVVPGLHSSQLCSDADERRRVVAHAALAHHVEPVSTLHCSARAHEGMHSAFADCVARLPVCRITLLSVAPLVQGRVPKVTNVRYAWRTTPCAYMACAVYSMPDDLPSPPFFVPILQ